MSFTDLAEALFVAQQDIDKAIMLSTIKRLRLTDAEAKPAPEVSAIIRNKCVEYLATNMEGCVQRDGAAALSVAGTPLSSTTTWSLAGDKQMVKTQELIGKVHENVQFQHLLGPKKGQLVLTGIATAIVHSMLQHGADGLKHFHTCDIVPVNSNQTDKNRANGAYQEPFNLRGLEIYFAPYTLGHFIGNQEYSVHLVQGAMGGRCLKSVAELKQLKLTPASPETYKVLGLEGIGQAKLTDGGMWGLYFLKGGAQVIGIIPSLGSMLAGPTSGGGEECLIVTMGVVNCVRALMGLKPIDPVASPLLACTTGKGRTSEQLQAIGKRLKVRGGDEWVHPSQSGGSSVGAFNVNLRFYSCS